MSLLATTPEHKQYSQHSLWLHFWRARKTPLSRHTPHASAQPSDPAVLRPALMRAERARPSMGAGPPPPPPTPPGPTLPGVPGAGGRAGKPPPWVPTLLLLSCRGARPSNAFAPEPEWGPAAPAEAARATAVSCEVGCTETAMRSLVEVAVTRRPESEPRALGGLCPSCSVTSTLPLPKLLPWGSIQEVEVPATVTPPAAAAAASARPCSGPMASGTMPTPCVRLRGCKGGGHGKDGSTDSKVQQSTEAP